ncbi:MAG TPA: putative metal-binding motif-containing protein, partial [Polyangia bacterium]
AHWIDLQNTQVNVAAAVQTVTADLNRLGIVGLVAGVCERCSIECELNTSCTTMDNAPGKCIAYGTACTKCVPTCDADGDGFCTNSARPDPNDADINISPTAAEVCGNNYDDNSNNHADEGCKACAGDADCTIGNEWCTGGFCNVCTGGCDPGTCRFGFMEPSMENPMGSPGVAGRCYDYGTGCSKCVPSCDADGDGFCTGPDRPNNQPGGDCNDANRDAYPMAPELCGNGVDDDCNGYVDDKCDPCVNGGQCPRAGFYCSIGACEGCQQACTPGDACKLPVAPGEVAPDGVCKAYGNSCSKCVPRCDVDGDGFCPNVTGNPNIPGGDCDDGEASVYPGAPVEVCGNGEDDNCNDVEDEGCEACSKDDDCPNGNACVGGVCDLCNAGCDVNACRFGVMEGMPGSGVQGKCFEYGAFKACQKCVPACDMDGDGYCPGATVSGQEGGDCLDNNVSAHPGAPEVCGNGLDDDCDGNADEECTSCNTSMMCPALESCSTRL